MLIYRISVIRCQYKCHNFFNRMFEWRLPWGPRGTTWWWWLLKTSTPRCHGSMGVSVARRPTRDWLVMATRTENSCEFYYVKQFHLFNDIAMYSIISPLPNWLLILHILHSASITNFTVLLLVSFYIFCKWTLFENSLFMGKCVWIDCLIDEELFDHCSFGSCLIMFMLLFPFQSASSRGQKNICPVSQSQRGDKALYDWKER